MEHKLPTLDKLPDVRLGTGYVDEDELPIMTQFSPLILIFALVMAYSGGLGNYKLMNILVRGCNDKK